MRDNASNHHTEWDLGISSTDRRTAGSLNETLPTGKYSYVSAFILLADASYQTEADDISVAGRSGWKQKQSGNKNINRRVERKLIMDKQMIN